MTNPTTETTRHQKYAKARPAWVLFAKVAPILVSALLLYLVFRNISAVFLWRAFLAAKLPFLLLSMLMVLVAMALKTYRCAALLWPLKPNLRIANVFTSLVTAFLADQILPAKAGEVLWAYIIGKKEDISPAFVIGTVAVGRVIDTVLILSLATATTLVFSLRNTVLLDVQLIGWALLAGMLIACILAIRSRNRVEAMSKAILPAWIATTLERFMNQLIAGLCVVKQGRHLWAAILFSTAMWVSMLMSYEFAIRAFDFGANPQPYAGVVLLLMATFGLMLPAAPGGVGIMQFACYLALRASLPTAILELPATLAAIGAFSIVFHITQILPELACGTFIFLKEGTSLPKLLARAQTTRIIDNHEAGTPS
jgi:uncharacterized protein (TIRG00374 family)